MKQLLKNSAVAGAILSGASSLFAQTTDKPNIVYIMADDLGWAELGCYGNTFNETPVLDQMAADGVRFTHAHCAASISSPTRAALMTGQCPYRVGIVDFLRGQADPLRSDVSTIAEVLSKNGYTTGMTGKWHLTGYTKAGATREIMPSERGFDETMVIENVSIGESSYFHPYHFNTNVQKVLSDANGKEFLVDRLNHEAVEFIKRNKDEPFFLYLSHYAVHTQLMGDPETVEYFRKKTGAGTSDGLNNPTNDPYIKFPKDYKANRNNPHLAAQLKKIDEGVGLILQELEKQGLLENTLVVFTSDNGGETNVTTNAPLRGGKRTLYEGGIRIPMIMTGYGVSDDAPKEIDTRIVTMDIMPTLCDLTGATPPEQECDGVSILPLLEGKTLAERELFWYYPPVVQQMTGSREIAAAIISGDYKLVEKYSYDAKKLSVISQELFNLKTDPSENNSLTNQNKTLVAELSKKIDDWRLDIHTSLEEIDRQVIYVAPDGTGDGSSWEKAASLTSAVEAFRKVDFAQIWLKEGTYTFTGSINFDKLYIYGGFKGDETQFDQRDWTKHPAIFDGNNQVSPLRNTRDRDRNNSVDCLLDGVIIQNGMSPNDQNGGAMLLNNGAIVRNCIFRNNQTRNGRNAGAIHCYLGTATIENSLFINNTSVGNAGAIQIGGGATCALINCTIANNKASGNSGGIALGNANDSHCTLVNTVAHNNMSSSGFNSYAQNGNINAGGKVKSINSAIESTSTKFTENDDVNHKQLSQTVRPGFANPSTVIGKATTAQEVAAVLASSYALADGSLCIDAGDTQYAVDLPFDLLYTDRVKGTAVDIGAYEYEKDDVLIANPGSNNINAFVVETDLYVSGAEEGSLLQLFNLRGELLHTQYVIDARDFTAIRLGERGVYFLKAGDTVKKFRY